jgi:amino acid transporter
MAGNDTGTGPSAEGQGGGGFGFTAVFLTSLCTILGAILFLRFGYAVANVGLLGTLGIVLLGHLVTIPTAMAVAEIATNRRVEGGGAYYIISRSFGIHIGAATGLALYFSQAISIAFYIIAFAEAFEPVIAWVRDVYGFTLHKQLISLPAMALLTLLMLTRGADLGMKALYVVAVILGLSLVFFYAGGTDYVPPPEVWADRVRGGDDFFMVFAICFPAFTGMAAGLGMSGDLKDPKTAIPAGTMLATLAGMLIYATVAIKLAYTGSPEALDADQLFMSRVALWGPIIPIGLAAASLSSALGSIMVAPRTLQALANDRVFQGARMNDWLSRARGKGAEPVNAALVTAAIGFAFIALGELDLVARIITMFFMVTYGAICLISFLEHFAADPAYRPSFRSHWTLSLLGFVFAVYLMFRISVGFTVLAGVLLVLMYLSVTWRRGDRHGMAAIFQGVSFQLSRGLQVFLQKANRADEETWRPSIVCISRDSFRRFAAFEMTTWLSHRYGFGTYVHLLPGYLSPQTRAEAREVLEKLLDLARASRSNVYCNTLISPSFTTAVAQVMQLPGVSGKDNNMALFEFSKHDPVNLDEIVDNHRLVKSTDFDLVLLRSSEKGFGLNHEIHVWISDMDYENANLMILLAYIVLGHPDWKGATIKLFAIFPHDQQEQARANLQRLVVSGRLPISAKNVEVIVRQEDVSRRAIISAHSREADLTFIGFNDAELRKNGTDTFAGYGELGNILFVSAAVEKQIQLLH